MGVGRGGAVRRAAALMLAKPVLVTVGDSATARTGAVTRALSWSRSPSLGADATGTLSRFRIDIGTAKVLTNFAFFTINPTTDVITDITATISSTLAVGVNEFVTAPIAVNAGDQLGFWADAACSLGRRGLVGSSWMTSSTLLAKPLPGDDLTATGGLSTAVDTYGLISATTYPSGPTPP